MNKIYLIAIGLSLSISSCKPSTQSAHAHDEVAGGTAHEEHNNQTLTLFSDQTEVFAEFHPLVVGQVSKFLAHITRLDTYKPYSEGKVSVSLIKDGIVYRQTVQNPSSLGIFTPSIMPKKLGVHTLVFEVESKFGKERFVSQNIEVYKNESDATKAIAEMQKENQTKFLKEQAWKIDFATTHVKQAYFNDIIKTTGELIASNRNEIEISAQSSGIIHFPSSDIVKGKTVKKGEALFFISGSGLSNNSLTSRFVSAQSEFKQAESNLERAKTLRADQIISEKEYLKTKTQFDKASVNFQIISKNYSASGIKISAPNSGFISHVFAKEGEYVEEGQLIGRIDRSSKLVLKADLYQKHLSQLSKIQSANFKLAYSDKLYKTDKLKGKIIAYGRDIDSDDYSTPVYIEIDKTPELYKGSYADVYLKAKSAQQVLSVPKSAVLEDQSIFFVFVQTDGESYEKRFVTIGMDNGEEIEIKSGLKADERVVSEGVYFVKLASLAGALPAHAHEH